MSKTRSGRRRAGALGLIAALVCVSVPVLGGPAAVAQDQELVLDVKRVVIPESREKLVEKGVSVKASCSAECVLVVKVRLPRGTARKIGLRGQLIGSGAAGAKADHPRWVRARINRGAGRRLLAYRGGGRILVRIRALP